MIGTAKFRRCAQKIKRKMIFPSELMMKRTQGSETPLPPQSSQVPARRPYQGSEIGKILEGLSYADRGLIVGDSSLRMQFFKYLTEHNFEPDNPGHIAALQRHMAAFKAQQGLRGSRLSGRPAAQQPIALLCSAIKKKDSKATLAFLDENPGLLLGSVPNAPNHNPITLAIEHDPEAKGVLSAICIWTAAQRANNNSQLPPNPMNSFNPAGQTPLSTVILEAASPACVDALVAAGADINATDAHGLPPLTFAVRMVEFPLILAILSHNPHMPIGPADPLAFVDPDSKFSEISGHYFDEGEDGRDVLHSLLLCASDNLIRVLTDPGIPAEDKAEVFLTRWGQYASSQDGDPEEEGFAKFGETLLENAVPHALETLFLHDVERAYQAVKLIDVVHNEGTTDQLFDLIEGKVMPPAGDHHFREFSLFGLAVDMTSEMKAFFKNKPETTAAFLTFLKNSGFDVDDSNNCNIEDLKSCFRIFKRLDWGQKVLAPKMEIFREKNPQLWDNAERPVLMKLLLDKRPWPEIKDLLDKDCSHLYDNVPYANSKSWVAVAERLASAYLEGGVLKEGQPDKFAEDIPKLLVLDQQAGQSPLTYAVVADPEANGQLSEMCMWIVSESGHNPGVAPDILDFTDINGETPLTTAVVNNSPACVDVLHTSGANVDAPNLRERTPLMLAAFAGNERMVYRLLNKGASPCAFHNGASAISLTLLNSNRFNAKTMDDVIFELLRSAPEHMEELSADLKAGKAAPHEIALAVADELCTWLSLVGSPNASVGAAALENLQSLTARAPDAGASLFVFNQAMGLKAFSDVIALMANLPVQGGSALAGALEPIFQSMWDHAISSVDLYGLLELYKIALKGTAEPDANKHFATHPGSARLVRRILARIPELAQDRLDAGLGMGVDEGAFAISNYFNTALTAPGADDPFVHDIVANMTAFNIVQQLKTRFSNTIKILEKESLHAKAFFKTAFGMSSFMMTMIRYNYVPTDLAKARVVLFDLLQDQPPNPDSVLFRG